MAIRESIFGEAAKRVLKPTRKNLKLINKNSFTGDLNFNEHSITAINQTKLYNLLQNNLLDNSYITIKDNNGYGNNLTGNMIYNLNQMATSNGDNVNTVVSIDDNGMLAKKQNTIIISIVLFSLVFLLIHGAITLVKNWLTG